MCSIFVCPPIIPRILVGSKYPVKEKIFVLSQLIASYAFIATVFSISVCPISTLILRSTKQAVTMEDIQMGVISSAIIGTCISALMRIFVLFHSPKIIHILYLNAAISLSGILLFVYPFQVVPGAKEFFDPVGSALRELIPSFFLWEISGLLIVVVILTELAALASGRNVSIGIFNERREFIETVTQHLTREELLESVKESIGSANEIRWLTWEGDLGIGNELVQWKRNQEKQNKKYVLRILITPDVKKIWEDKGLLAEFQDHYKVTNVGLLRFLVFDRAFCIEALPMPPSLATGANTGIKTYEPSRVRELFSLFESWWNDIK